MSRRPCGCICRYRLYNQTRMTRYYLTRCLGVHYNAHSGNTIDLRGFPGMLDWKYTIYKPSPNNISTQRPDHLGKNHGTFILTEVPHINRMHYRMLPRTKCIITREAQCFKCGRPDTEHSTDWISSVNIPKKCLCSIAFFFLKTLQNYNIDINQHWVIFLSQT